MAGWAFALFLALSCFSLSSPCGSPLQRHPPGAMPSAPWPSTLRDIAGWRQEEEQCVEKGNHRRSVKLVTPVNAEDRVVTGRRGERMSSDFLDRVTQWDLKIAWNSKARKAGWAPMHGVLASVLRGGVRRMDANSPRSDQVCIVPSLSSGT